MASDISSGSSLSQGPQLETSNPRAPFPNRFQTVLFGRRRDEAETTEPPR
jgi:hypothetical protein